jgi:competence protein ComEA
MEEETASPPAQTFFQKFGPALILGGLSLFFIIAACVLLFKTTQTSEPILFSNDQNSASSSSRMIVADIEGAVASPGLYELPEGARVEELLTKAGGLTQEADSEWVAKTLNRASLLSDGAKFFIPKKGAVATDQTGVVQKAGSAVSGISVTNLISINTASEKELDTLPGVGPVTAGKIISGRPYQRLEELLEKKVLNSSVYEKIKSQLSL